MIKRVHIVGGPGSGKTTLAHQIAEALQIPCYELDKIGYEGGAGNERPLETRLEDVHQITVQPGWVSEGIYLDWTVELWEHADRIIWLDLPWRIAGWRIVLRHIRAELRGNNPHHGWRKLVQFLGWCRGYYQNTSPSAPGETRAKTEAVLKAFQPKLIRCVVPLDVVRVRNSLKA